MEGSQWFGTLHVLCMCWQSVTECYIAICDCLSIQDALGSKYQRSGTEVYTVRTADVLFAVWDTINLTLFSGKACTEYGWKIVTPHLTDMGICGPLGIGHEDC